MKLSAIVVTLFCATTTVAFAATNEGTAQRVDTKMPAVSKIAAEVNKKANEQAVAIKQVVADFKVTHEDGGKPDWVPVLEDRVNEKADAIKECVAEFHDKVLDSLPEGKPVIDDLKDKIQGQIEEVKAKVDEKADEIKAHLEDFKVKLEEHKIQMPDLKPLPAEIKTHVDAIKTLMSDFREAHTRENPPTREDIKGLMDSIKPHIEAIRAYVETHRTERTGVSLPPITAPTPKGAK